MLLLLSRNPETLEYIFQLHQAQPFSEIKPPTTDWLRHAATTIATTSYDACGPTASSHVPAGKDADGKVLHRVVYLGSRPLVIPEQLTCVKAPPGNFPARPPVMQGGPPVARPRPDLNAHLAK